MIQVAAVQLVDLILALYLGPPHPNHFGLMVQVLLNDNCVGTLNHNVLMLTTVVS